MADSNIPRISTAIECCVENGGRHSHEDHIRGKFPSISRIGASGADFVQKKNFVDLNQGFRDMIDGKVVGRYVYSWQ